MEKISKLKVNRKYLLKHTGNFSHCVGKDGFKAFSKRQNGFDRIEAIFIGKINSGVYGSERNIFYSDDNKRSYISFGTDSLDYVVKELN